VLSLGVFFEPAEAKKSAGTYLTEIGSKKICGLDLCGVPQSIEEKIAAFFESKRIHEGSVEQQVGRFSEGGVSQQAIEPFDSSNAIILDGQERYRDNKLGISIIPGSFDTVNVFSETSENRNVIFTSNMKNYNYFPPYFTIMKIQHEETSIQTKISSEFKEEFVKSYVEGLLSNTAISDVEISQSSTLEIPDYTQLEVSGQIINILGSDTTPTKFSIIVLFSESGNSYSLTLNTAPEDYEQSVQEFKKSYETFEVLSEVKEKKDKENKDKEKKSKEDKSR